MNPTSNTALILIDIQMDYFDGAMPLVEPERALANATQLLSSFRKSQAAIFHIQQENHNPELPFLLANTPGQALHQAVQPIDGEALIIKNYPNAFWQTALFDKLKDQSVEQVVIAGMMSQLCVKTTASSAMEHGFGVTLVEDACATTGTEINGYKLSAEQVHWAAMASLSMFAKITTTLEFLAGHTQAA